MADAPTPEPRYKAVTAYTVPLPEPDGTAEANQRPHPGGGYEYEEVSAWSEPLVHAHAAAISAERDARIKVLEEQVRVLTKLVDASEGGVDVDGVNWFDLREAARAALGDKT